VDLSIIIVNYNVKEFLQNCINSIQKATKNITSEIIVVDNASDDGSVELLQAQFPEVKLFINEKNLGFSAANNIGLKYSSGKYLLLLNPDTIVEENTFDTLIDFFQKTPDAGLAGCKILNPDGTLQLACRRSFPGPWTSFCKVTGLSSLFPKSKIFARYNLTYLDENKTYEVDAISGSFMMMKREVFEKIGGLDEIFFMYGEDLDWCYRVQKSGYKVYYVNSTQIIHYKGESTKRSSLDETKLFYNAMHLFVKKHLATSFLVEIILRSAIMARELIAFIGRGKLILISVVFDILAFNVSLFLAENIYSILKGWFGFPDDSLWIVFTVPVAFHILTGFVLRNYKKDNISLLSNLISISAAFFVISSLTYFFKDYAYSRGIVILTYFILFFLSSLWRVIYKFYVRVGLPGLQSAKINTLIVGTSSSAIEIASKLKSNYTSFHSIVGLISQTRKEIGTKAGNFDVIGSIENIRKIIHEKKINEVIFSSKELSYKQIMSIVAECQQERVEFRLAGENIDFIVGKSSINLLNDIPLFEISYNISQPVNRFFKRLFDIVLSLFLLVFLYPFIFILKGRKAKENTFGKLVLSTPKVLFKNYSFVGPYNSENQGSLYLGKPGLTGLWFTEIEEAESLEKLNIFYAKNQNLWLDLEIIGKTIQKLLMQRD
jgi:GT2 family glycosyltransferase